MLVMVFGVSGFIVLVIVVWLMMLCVCIVVLNVLMLVVLLDSFCGWNMMLKSWLMCFCLVCVVV